MFLSGFGVRVILVSENELKIVSSSPVFLEEFVRFGVGISLNIWWSSPVKSFGTELSLQ